MSSLLLSTAMALDRAGLVRRRQQIRAKEDAPQKSSDTATKQQQQKKKRVSKEAPTKRKQTVDVVDGGRGGRTAATGSVNAADSNVPLLIRQVLQRPHYGDLTEYLKTASKEQLFEQTSRIAKFANEVCVCVLDDAAAILRSGV